MPFDMHDVTLKYFDILGRGEPVRTFLEDAGIVYTEDNDLSNWSTLKHDLGKFPFQLLPVLYTNGQVIAQQDAILRYIAKAVGRTFEGSDAERATQELVPDMLGVACEDLMTPYLRGVYYDPEHPKQLLNICTDVAPKAYKQFETMLERYQSPAGFFTKLDAPSWAEYSLLHCVHCVNVLHPRLLSEYPRLSTWQAAMLDRPGIKAFHASGRRKTAINDAPTADRCLVEA